MTTSTSFITTAIPFVNARPHLGFAYELVLADVLARHRRRRGREVRFVCGTDDHSLKSVAAAAREGVETRVLVERNAAAFRALGPLLEVAPDDFVRTSDDPRHAPAVRRLWRACADAGALERRAWRGLYCAGCEAFVDDDAPCAEHGVAPEPVAEDNWFFRLGRWRAPVRDAIASGRLAILPEAARAETLAFLDGEVRDLSISRDAARARGWGIEVPGDPTQVIYVWFDALTNYLTSLGYGDPGAPALVERYWRAGGERTHVIGKGISRFHAAYWPAFLLAAGLPLPDRILVHGYLTVGGAKLRKSAAATATDAAYDVPGIVARFGSDAVRWYFARRCRTRADSDVVLDDIARAHDADLVGRLGNLVQRCLRFADPSRTAAALAAPAPDDAALRALAAAVPARVDTALDAFLPDDAVASILELVDAANVAVEQRTPWRLAPALAAAAVAAPLEAARLAAAELAPFVPATARAIAARLGDGPPAWGALALRPGDGPVLARLADRAAGGPA